jgi:hypothetical protein
VHSDQLADKFSGLVAVNIRAQTVQQPLSLWKTFCNYLASPRFLVYLLPARKRQSNPAFNLIISATQAKQLPGATLLNFHVPHDPFYPMVPMELTFTLQELRDLSGGFYQFHWVSGVWMQFDVVFADGP